VAQKALASPPAEPVVPPPDSGRGKTPLAAKLGVKEGTTLLLLGAPRGFEQTLAPLPKGVRIARRATGRAGIAVQFAERARGLEARIRALEPRLEERGQLWIAWPKKSSGVASDLDQGGVQRAGLAAGLVDTKICAIDETWSGLRFSRRRS